MCSSLGYPAQHQVDGTPQTSFYISISPESNQGGIRLVGLRLASIIDVAKLFYIPLCPPQHRLGIPRGRSPLAGCDKYH
jgi:hypothetical protein